VVERVDADIAMRADQVLVGRNATRFATNQRIRTLLGRADWRPVSGDRLVCLRNNHDLGLLNGAIWQCVGADDADDKVSLSIFDEDANVTQDVIGHTHHFEGRSDQLPWYERKDAEEFDYGYALTVHKSQGSQWRNVMLFNEGGAFRQDRWRWLYTGITRASEQLTLVHTT
jgi:exodeoxyribonuclease-5